MTSIRRTGLLVAASILLCLIVEAAAFGGNNIPSFSYKTTTSLTSQSRSTAGTTASASKSLYAVPPESDINSNDNNSRDESRRNVLGSLRRAVVGAATLSAFRQGPKVALADDSVPTTGRVVVMEIANLDGVEGKTGTVKIQLRPEWAPRGAKRFEVRVWSCVVKSVDSFFHSYDLLCWRKYLVFLSLLQQLQELTDQKFYDECRMFRVLPGFVAQFGINGNPTVQSKWRSSSIPDDPVKVSNTRGTVVFATAGPNTRTTQIFINTRDEGNAFLDRQGFSPFGQVIEGMDIVDRFYAGYGEGAPAGKGPNQGLIQARGNSYLESYPKLSYIKEARFLD